MLMLAYVVYNCSVERFYSLGQNICKFPGKKEVFTWKKTTWEKIFLVHLGFVQSLEFLKKSWNLPKNFPDLEKVWKIEIKSWKNYKESFLKVTVVLYKWNFFRAGQILFNLACTFAAHHGKSVVSSIFFRSLLITHFITLSLEKEIVVLEKVLNFGSKNLYEPCTLTWPPFHWFGTPIWPPWRHVKRPLIGYTRPLSPEVRLRYNGSRRKFRPAEISCV